MRFTKQNCIKHILQHIPAFNEYWQPYYESWKGNAPGLCSDISRFSDYIIESINENKHPEELVKIFNLVETLLVNGDDEVKDAIATCFLENLLNATSSNRVKAKNFVSYLGNESRAYCKAWDEFTGVCTEGL